MRASIFVRLFGYEIEIASGRRMYAKPVVIFSVATGVWFDRNEITYSVAKLPIPENALRKQSLLTNVTIDT
jgi:hypothetical protein